ncbi:MAG: DUF3084 domain-containing protein [Acholeplasmataceae bacterium]|nr:DUF3084 domain-containing protein [Acholeplasmataceae bacterium]
MFGLTLILVLAIMGGAIAFIGDKLGSKIGKKRLSIFGLRPYHTSVLMTVITGIMIAAATLGVLAVTSKDVKTALFGMEKLKAEMVALNNDKLTAQKELADKNKLIASLDNQIKETTSNLEEMQRERDAINAQLLDLQDRYAQADADLAAMKAEVEALEASREKLNAEIKELEDATAELRAGLIAIREGEVVFRAGEVLYSGILNAGLSEEENDKQMDTFLASANQVILARMEVKTKDVQALWLPNTMVQEAKKVLASSRGTMYIRICAAGNIISGEMAVSRLEMVPNKIVYEEGQKIFTENITIASDGRNINSSLMYFLSEINKAAVAAGVMPDPLTGKVGNIDAASMIEVTGKMQELGGNVTLTAYAKQDINVAGPVLLRLDVRRNE